MPDPEAIYQSLRRFLPPIAWLPEECWIVGGSLRDVLTGGEPKDLDCAAPRAADAAAAFATRTGGKKICLATKPLETWRVILNGLDWDFTDIDGDSIDADLGRRDFTIGALALSIRSPRVLIDPFGGVRDIEQRIVRMVSATNLLDDPLRMIRAVRIAGRLDFTLDDETREFIRANAARIRTSAPERITAELDAIITARDVRRALELLMTTRLDAEVLPFELDEAAVKRCAGIFSPDAVARYAALFAGCEDQLAGFAEKARWSRERQRNVSALLAFVASAVREGSSAENAFPLLVHDSGTRTARRAAELLAAVGQAESARILSNLVRERGSALENLRAFLDGAEAREIAGVEDGPELGRILRALVEAQIRGEVRTRAEAVSFVRQFRGNRE